MKELSVENQIYLCKYWDIDKSLYTTIGLKEDEVKETLEKVTEAQSSMISDLEENCRELCIEIENRATAF